ncbi:tRNA pseudouridine(55) synthase TruB [Lachnospira multipara]|jgi:tRNA pseudouridine55 synthase|uniref:tRNA pseudouridine(55) synthase TruB n=1 Tax=Lachnospira multipara TaxID=28051 RepID=UPI00048380C7|nr:tRNA pseudouridine(55) synthase TruB [Lachnospira multipara]
MNGIINVYKEQGFTSHDVVAKLRGILKYKKIGHTGTLDPDAVGVLPVCLGKGTKICSMITDWDKTYETVMLLGTVTDTADISGNVLKSSEVNVTEADILEACESFVGEYMQVPPMYSALKVNGKKLYELARNGIEVERKARKVTIKSLHVNDIDLEGKNKFVTMTVECSKGTYIRTLCEDIGKKLGCGACMYKLTRKRVGQFVIDDTLTLNQISALCLKGEFESVIKPIDEMFPDYTKLMVKSEGDKLLHNGNKIELNNLDIFEMEDRELEFVEDDKLRVYDSSKEFVGIYTVSEGMLIPIQMFYAPKDN